MNASLVTARIPKVKSRLQICPVCDREPTWSTLDLTTGWTFCNDCWLTVHALAGQDPTFAEWLRAIAESRDNWRLTNGAL